MDELSITEIGTTICIALCAAIGVLWKDHRNSKALSEKRHQKCEDQHAKTRGDLLSVTREVGELKGQVTLAKEIIPKLDELGDLIGELKENA